MLFILLSPSQGWPLDRCEGCHSRHSDATCRCSGNHPLGVLIPPKGLEIFKGENGRIICNDCHGVDMPEKWQSHTIDPSRLITGEFLSKMGKYCLNVYAVCSLGCHEMQTQEDLRQSGVNVEAILKFIRQRKDALNSSPKLSDLPVKIRGRRQKNELLRKAKLTFGRFPISLPKDEEEHGQEETSPDA